MTYERFIQLNSQFVSTYKELAFKAYCYSKYQMEWLLSHGVTFDEVIISLLKYAQNYGLKDIKSILVDWTGSRKIGMIYSSFEEFVQTEYQQEKYMRGLLNNEDYALYIKDNSTDFYIE